MILNTLLTAVADDINQTIQGLRSCQSHPGRFDLRELKRIAAAAPAIRVAVLKIGRGVDVGTGEVDRPVDFAAYVLTEDKRGMPRDFAARNIVESLICLLPGKAFGVANVHPIIATDVGEAVNLYSSSVDGQGVALWAVSWSQVVRFGENELLEDGTMPSSLIMEIRTTINGTPDETFELTVGDGDEG